MTKKVVLLDIDGTLVDSCAAHAMSWKKAFDKENIKLPYQSILSSIGMGADQFLPQVAGISSRSHLGEGLSKARGEIFRSEFLPTLKAFDGSIELLKTLKELHLKLIVASSSSKEDGEKIINKFGFDQFIDEMTCSADAERSKPNPDIVFTALKKARVEPHEAFMLGDTPYDIAAAVEAGVDIYAFTSELWTIEKLPHAKRYFEGPRDLVKQIQSKMFGF